ncbi:MAG: nickel/cobalt efflux protein RcnA, partial [Prosthecochloris sp.]|nr:nickel/cobalt efflux protein RcnA [Prosthecochloris sp.]
MDISFMIEEGNTNPLILVAAASVIGVLHGLEPGHAKTM